MKIRFFVAVTALFALLAVPSCSVVQQVATSYATMANCQYDYRSITGLSVAGINVSEGLSVANALKMTALLSGKQTSIPLNLVLNLDVTNANQTEAMLNGMQYVLTIDDVEFTTGSLAQQFRVPAGGTGVMPLTVGFDLATLLSGASKDAATNALKNFIGIGDKKSNVSLKIKPSFLVNGYTVTSPSYIPVNFSFGGK